MRRMLFLLALAPSLAAAGPIEDGLRGAEDGWVLFSYDTRPGVRGNGHGIYLGERTVRGRTGGWRWMSDCDEGPARVALRVRSGEIRELETTVGSRWEAGGDPTTDLGRVESGEAAAFLLELARHGRDSVAKDAIFPATIARGVTVWPALLEVARDGDRSSEVRKAALFWVGQAAAEAVTRDLEAFVNADDENLEVRKAAVFALSQRPPDECIPALTRIARTHPHPEIRKNALFWLGQEDDPRVLDLFEEILLGDKK